jgi:hypothetical protein
LVLFAAETRFYKNPIDQFIERMAVLVDRGHKRPQVAFQLCVVEKEFKNQTAILEQQVAHDQVRTIVAFAVTLTHTIFEGGSPL